uniref:Bifunctional inhibitor/plant lipid transfer protein/seed storage helical domain-containing protein n=1 Tax=Arundo donax TaxID=35708 RepID=A0A0A8ZYK5_ARUDO
MRRILSASRAMPNRLAICTCLKNLAAGSAGGPYITRAAGLPGRCGVPLPYKLSPNMNCNSYVKFTVTFNFFIYFNFNVTVQACVSYFTATCP